MGLYTGRHLLNGLCNFSQRNLPENMNIAIAFVIHAHISRSMKEPSEGLHEDAKRKSIV